MNAICPSTVGTNFLDAGTWSEFLQEHITPIEKIVEMVLMLIDGREWTNTKGGKGRKRRGLS